MKYIVFETQNTNKKSYFALTNEQIADPASKVLFKENTKEIARVNTVNEMKNLDTEYRISYISNGKIKFA